MDASLVSMIKKDDREAFAILYNQYWRSLLTYASKRLPTIQDAEEVVQEIFINLWERRHTLEISGSLDAYLHAAVRYKIYNRYRDYFNNHQAHLIPGLDEVEDITATDEQLDHKELESKMRSAIDSLPCKCRDAFLLSRESSLSNKNIAQRLGISVNTVEKHIGKALRLLRLKLK